MSRESLDRLEQFLEIAAQFESAWRQGLRPRIEGFLSAVPQSQRAELLHELLSIELELRRRAEESPGPEDYRERFPLDGALLDDIFAGRSTGRAIPSSRLSDSRELTMPVVPGYRIVRLLGSAGFSEVWLAEDLNLFHRPAALKMIRPRATPETRQDVLGALRNEAALLVGVRHPNLVQVFSWLQSDDDPGLVLQYVPGCSLADRLDRERPLKWQAAARYVADVAEGLLSLHAQGIVHRDVKPGNMLWDPEIDEALLTDLGVGARLAGPAGLAGAIPDMAPEAFDGQISPALDVYGLAVSLFTLVTGQRPFPGPTIDDLLLQANRGLPDPDPRCAGLPEPLERIVRDGLSAEPASRPSLSEFVAILRCRLNHLLADTLAMKTSLLSAESATEPEPDASPPGVPEPTTEAAPPSGPVGLRLIVSQQVGPNRFVPIAATSGSAASAATRDMRKVPPRPEQVRLRTGDRMRIEAVADRAGYITVFNVGPTGNLNLLYPDDSALSGLFTAPLLPANKTTQVLDVETTAPAGPERLFAVWSRQPLPLRLDRLHSLVEPKGKKTSASRPYVATRDLKRVQQSVQQLQPGDWHAVVLELEHEA
jgi:serine/threonine protein kinase